MFGRREEVICPYCGHTYIESFGGSTYSYYVNESEHSYVECNCPSCKTSFWYSFVAGSMEKQDEDVTKLCAITNY